MIPTAECRTLKILPIPSLFRYSDSIYTNNILHKNTPDYINLLSPPFPPIIGMILETNFLFFLP